MKGTLKIATLFKIPVYLHWSFTLILLYILFFGYQFDASVQEYAVLVVLFSSVFVCVVLHEYGHALTARKFGVETRDIILSPLGGIARLEKIPEKPIEELKVAIAGPLVNIVIALIFLPIVIFLRRDGLYIIGPNLELDFFGQLENLGLILLISNLGLFIFNLIPAFPMDGGRILRSLLAMNTSRVKATKIAFIVAQFCAFALFIFGFMLPQYIMCFIAIFVVITSRIEWKSVAREAALENKTVQDLIQPISQRLYKDQAISDVVTIRKNQALNYLIFDRNEQVAGVLFHQFIMHAAQEKDLDAPIEKYLSSTWEELSIHYPLKKAIALFQQRGYGIVPIRHNGQLVGQLDMIHINNYIRSI